MKNLMILFVVVGIPKAYPIHNLNELEANLRKPREAKICEAYYDGCNSCVKECGKNKFFECTNKICLDETGEL